MPCVWHQSGQPHSTFITPQQGRDHQGCHPWPSTARAGQQTATRTPTPALLPPFPSSQCISHLTPACHHHHPGTSVAPTPAAAADGGHPSSPHLPGWPHTPPSSYTTSQAQFHRAHHTVTSEWCAPRCRSHAALCTWQ